MNSTAENDVPFRNVAPFFLSSFVWNLVLGMSFLLVPLYATFLGLSGAQVGTIISLPVVLHIAISLTGGALADRLGGKNLSSVSCAFTVLSALMFLVAGNFAMLLVAQFLMVTARSTFWIANLSLATQLPGNPARQMGRFTVATNAGQIVGSVFAGLAIKFADFDFGFWAMAAAGLAALLLNQMIRFGSSARKRTHSAYAVYRQLLAKRPIIFSMVCAYVFALPVALSLSFYPILFDFQQIDSSISGLLISTRGIGSIVAGFFVWRLVKRVPMVTPPLGASIAIGTSVLLTAAMSQSLPIGIFMFTLGVGSAILNVYTHMVIRSATTDDIRGSALALFNVGFGISLLTTPALMGIMSDWIGVDKAFYIMGAFTVLVALLMVPIQRWAFAAPGAAQQ
ncbi:MFS transporter [Lacisediminimonas sp.]|uniref:MFS transporter n=1 Tax=Lacisediminimonas sp. TaxID=3060582 RepID=UPI00272629A4|nr:MFS transporter [Lacisediminimonas sp.]MDO8299848.1 MFS transporter [Lacisediminimonas sp.]